jgi:hypothetical protein
VLDEALAGIERVLKRTGQLIFLENSLAADPPGATVAAPVGTRPSASVRGLAAHAGHSISHRQRGLPDGAIGARLLEPIAEVLEPLLLWSRAEAMRGTPGFPNINHGRRHAFASQQAIFDALILAEVQPVVPRLGVGRWKRALRRSRCAESGLIACIVESKMTVKRQRRAREP